MNYFRVETESMTNGPGLRTILWVAGCEHHCKNCHNPETWSKDGGEKFTKETIETVMKEVGQDYCKGITYSGGDPLASYNLKTVTNLAKRIREEFGNKKDIWLYTGYTYEEVKKLSIMKYIDVLVDGKFIEELKDATLLWRGSSNQRIIDMNKTREHKKIVLYNNKDEEFG